MTNHVNRLQREVRELARGSPADPAPVPPADAAAEDHQLAREAAQAFADQLARFRTAKAGNKPPDPAVAPDDWDLKMSREKAPEDFTFADVERLARHDPAESAARWDEVKAAARGDLDSGWLAGRALEYQGGSAWDRACFLAVRQRLRRAWPPRHDGEASLIDEIAQYETLRQHWVRLLARLTQDPRLVLSLNGADEQPHGRPPPGVAAGAVVAVRVIDRLHRLSQSATRTLLGLRRSTATVRVQNTGPMNLSVGLQQNVTGPRAAETDAEARVVRVDAPG